MVVMKRTYLFNLSLFLTLSIFAQSEKEAILKTENNEINSRFITRKEKGFYNIMHVSLLLGSSQFIDGQNNSNTRPPLNISPSFTITNGYLINKHWAAGAGVGYEIFNYNLFPLFAQLRYTLWDHKISPFLALDGGYSFANFKAKHYDELYLNWPPYNINDTRLRNYGGLMIQPEAGVKVPLNENSDLLFTVGYRYQKTKSVARKEYTNGQFDEWEHNEYINRLSFGIAIMFR